MVGSLVMYKPNVSPIFITMLSVVFGSFQVHMGALWAILDLITFFAVLVPMCLFSRSEKGKPMPFFELLFV